MSEPQSKASAANPQVSADDEGHRVLQEQADVIQDLAELLVQDIPGDDRFWRFRAMAFHAVNAFSEPPFVNTLESIRTEAGRRELLGNPAAAPLLAYFVTALQRFNSAVDDEELANAKTDKRCRWLADAFGLLGKQGERRPQVGQGGSLSTQFGYFVQQAVRAMGLPEGKPLPEKHREAVRREALRKAYLARHQAEYESAHPEDKERMRKLREDLSEHGWDVAP